MIYTMEYPSPVGVLTLAGDEAHVTGLWIAGQKYFGATLPGEAAAVKPVSVVCSDSLPLLGSVMKLDSSAACGSLTAEPDDSVACGSLAAKSNDPAACGTLTGTDRPAESDSPTALARAAAWLDRYFAGEKPSPRELPLAPAGSAFRQTVWNILCDIPCGEVTTYREIAKKIAAALGLASMSAQAVGGAVAHNPISIIIPCHRVVGANGSLTGYAGGLAAKQYLLAHEGVDITRFSLPKRI